MEKLIEARTKVVIKHSVFGTVLCFTEVEESPDVKTMDTDGVKVFYNKEFAEGLDYEELVGCLGATSLKKVCVLMGEWPDRIERWTNELWKNKTVKIKDENKKDVLLESWKDGSVLKSENDIEKNKNMVVNAYNIFKGKHTGYMPEELATKLGDEKAEEFNVSEFEELASNIVEGNMLDKFDELNRYDKCLSLMAVAKYVGDNWGDLKEKYKNIVNFLENIPLDISVLFWRNLSSPMAIKMAKKKEFDKVVDMIMDALTEGE